MRVGKAFESVFGGVTCLPGCFCMYRLKARGEKGWIPILVNPDILDAYSIDSVDTLHQKNLLLLGEDRFLSTLMLRRFPARKMVFVPKAKCKTVVPDDFKTLLSQRRRWINSTIHNLMELVLVNNLCGTFCFSMQVLLLVLLFKLDQLVHRVYGSHRDGDASCRTRYNVLSPHQGCICTVYRLEFVASNDPLDLCDLYACTLDGDYEFEAESIRVVFDLHGCSTDLANCASSVCILAL